MTSIPSGKSFVRKTASMVQGRPLVVILHPGYLEVRQHGRRSAFSLSYDAIYTEAAKRYAAREREVKQAMKKAKKAGRV